MGRKKIFLLSVISNSRLKALLVKPWLGTETPSILRFFYSNPFRTPPPARPPPGLHQTDLGFSAHLLLFFLPLVLRFDGILPGKLFAVIVVVQQGEVQDVVIPGIC